MATDKKEVMKSAIDKVKMVDTGVKRKELYPGSDVSEKVRENKIIYPTLYINSMEAPVLEGCEVGCEATLIVKAEVISCSSNKDSNGKKNESYTLEIHEVGVVKSDKTGKGKQGDEEEADDENEEEGDEK